MSTNDPLHMITCSTLGDCFVGSTLPPRSQLQKSVLIGSSKWQVPVNNWLSRASSALAAYKSDLHSLQPSYLNLHQKMHFKGYMDGNPFCHQKSSQIESHCKNNQLEADPSGVSPKLRKNIPLIKYFYVKID